MISVLDVLCKPVFSPIDLFTVNWSLKIIKNNPELVMLHLVVDTSVALNSTVSLFLILEVIPHSFFQFCKLASIFRMLRYSQNLTKEYVMFIVKPGVISSKGFIPHIRLWDWMLKVPLVSKISVFDVLCKPVLSPLDLLILDWSIHLDKSLTEQHMFLLMLLAVVPGEVD